MASVTVSSGTIQGAANIKRQYRNAVKQALEIAVNDGLRQFGKTVAQKTGAMRAGVEQGGSGGDRRRIVIKALTRGQDIIIRQEDIEQAIIDNERKIKWHMRQSPDFNPIFAAGYKNPSTPFTKPIDSAVAMQYIATRARAEIKKQLRLAGFDVS